MSYNTDPRPAYRLARRLGPLIENLSGPHLRVLRRGTTEVLAIPKTLTEREAVRFAARYGLTLEQPA